MARHLRQEKEDQSEAVDEATVKYGDYDPPHSSNYLCFKGRHSGRFRGFLKMNDVVDHPEHYQGKVECIDCLEAATEGLTGIEAVCTANAIKYLYRWKRKNGKEDLRKAMWYINHLIEHIDGDSANA